MAEPTLPEALRLELHDIESQVDFDTVKHNDRPYIHVLVAWAILSATYSVDDEASINILRHSQEKDILHLQFHLDDKQTLDNLYSRVEEELAGGVKQFKDTESPKGGIPKTLITTSLDSIIYDFLDESTYDIAIAPSFIACKDGKNGIRLNVCSKSSLAKSELDLVLARLNNLFTQFHRSMQTEIQKLDYLIPSDKTDIAALNENIPSAEYIFAHEVSPIY
jgi:hypothetical protein